MIFHFFLVIFDKFIIIPVDRENIKVKFPLAFPIGAPAIVVNEIIDTSPVLALKIIKIFSCNQMHQCIYLIFYCMIFLD